MWAAPFCFQSQPPTSSLRLHRFTFCLLQHCCTTELERGGLLYDTSHVNRLRGGAQCAHLCCHTVHFSLHILCSLTSSHTNAICTQTPCGGFGNPSSDPNVSAQSRTKAHHRRLLRSPLGPVPFLPVCSSQD